MEGRLDCSQSQGSPPCCQTISRKFCCWHELSMGSRTFQKVLRGWSCQAGLSALFLSLSLQVLPHRAWEEHVWPGRLRLLPHPPGVSRGLAHRRRPRPRESCSCGAARGGRSLDQQVHPGKTRRKEEPTTPASDPLFTHTHETVVDTSHVQPTPTRECSVFLSNKH